MSNFHIKFKLKDDTMPMNFNSGLYVFMSVLSFLITAILVVWQVTPAWASDWVMSVQKENLAPFKYRTAMGPAGINVEIINAIALKVGADIEYKDDPIDVGREKFLTGALTVDCCLNEIWFPLSDPNIQMFSDPIYKLIEVFVFKRGKSFPVPNTLALRDKKVGGIKGFTYPNQEDFGQRIDGDSPLDVLQMLLDDKIDVAVLERHAASFHINQRKFKAEFGDPFYSVQVGVRLHKNLAPWMDGINKAIAELRETGVIQDIIQRNIR